MGILQKLAGQWALMRRDPERFARNISQFTHPQQFEERLVDIVNPSPIHVRYDPAQGGLPRLNVLDAAWTKSGMTGGPNTVINLACRVAQQGVKVRLVSTARPTDFDSGWFRHHAESLLGTSAFPDIEIASAAQAEAPLVLGPRDIFLATHWSTAQQLKPVLPQLAIRQFFYMLQEFEPGFYPWSSNYALAIETFGLDFWPIVNEALLADYLLAMPFGRLNDPETRRRAMVFDPAVDEALFFPPAERTERPKRLLFYARPTNKRNMFGIGLQALRAAAADPVFAGWEFLSIGSQDSIADMALANGHVLRRGPWLNYVGYANLLRDADVMLCPMLSPHTSYPVLEMAACGGLSVTNSFATKTSEAFAKLSSNIVTVPPTIEGFTEGLRTAATQVNAGRAATPSLNMARSWDATLDPVAREVARIVGELAA